MKQGLAYTQTTDTERCDETCLGDEKINGGVRVSSELCSCSSAVAECSDDVAGRTSND